MRVTAPGVVLTMAAVLAPAVARADHRPTLSTDGFYVGVRGDPGAALAMAWDLDVYLTRNRMLSIGPGVSLSVLGSPVSLGRQQDFLLAVDVLRFKIGVNAPGGEFRPFFMVGGGFSYFQLPAQYVSGVAIVPPGDRRAMATTGDQYFPALSGFAPMFTAGAGVDLFTSGPIGFTALLTWRIDGSNTNRMPDTWLEFAIGIRFGL